MVKFYVRRIMIDKKMTIDEVPEKWREKVRAEIEKTEQTVQGHLRIPFIGLCNNYFCRIMTVKGETKDVSEKIQFGQCF